MVLAAAPLVGCPPPGGGSGEARSPSGAPGASRSPGAGNAPDDADQEPGLRGTSKETGPAGEGLDESSSTRRARARLVDELRAQGIEDPRVLAAIGRVPRHRMVPEGMRDHAYRNRPLPIGHEQTISQPFVVALMSQLAEIGAGDRVLEVGTGSGYQAAVLAELGAQVYSIEIVPALARRARGLLDDLGYGDDVSTRVGDGFAGWPEAAPFQAILLTAAPPTIPTPLKEQLAVGGRLVAPVGEDGGVQELVVMRRTGPEDFETRSSILVRFVPMTGRAQGESAD